MPPSLPSGPSTICDAVPLLRRSRPSRCTGDNGQGLRRRVLASLYPVSLPDPDTVHQYNFKSLGRDYAFLTVWSHACNVRDTPLLYYEEEIRGFVSLSLTDLRDMMSLNVVVSQFLD